MMNNGKIKMWVVLTHMNVLCAISYEKDYAYSFANIFNLKKPKKIYFDTKKEADEFEHEYNDKILEYYSGYWERIEETPFPILVHDAVDELLIDEFAIGGLEPLVNLKHMLTLIEPSILNPFILPKMEEICDDFKDSYYKEAMSYCSDPGCYDLHEVFESSINYRMMYDILTKRYLAMLNDPYRKGDIIDLSDYK